MVIEGNSSESWRLLEFSYSSVFQNLALEQTLARACISPVFVPVVRLWRNPQAVVVGRFQDVDAEVDLEACRRNSIDIARRFTGGGAVFHDLGNLNLTIVIRRPSSTTLSRIHEGNSSVILDMLTRLGVKGVFAPPNSIHVNGRKISGAAAALGRDFILWHASILVSTDTVMLRQVLAPSQQIMKTSAIRSKRHPVTTLTEELSGPVDMKHVQRTLLLSCQSVLNAKFERSDLLDEEKQNSRLLYDKKYSSQDWNLHRYCEGEEWDRKRGGAHTTIAV